MSRLNNLWDQPEIDFLMANYYTLGPQNCAEILGRSLRGIYVKANRLRLHYQHQGPVPKKRERLDATHCLATCRQHGKTKHYIQAKTNKIFCIKCRREHDRKRKQGFVRQLALKEASRKSKRKIRSTMLGRYTQSLRNAMARYRYGIGGCFRLLPYSPQDLHDHLERVRAKQKNRCPTCRRSYMKVGFHVDHVMSLRNAKTKEAVLNLFALTNLSLLCPSCNIRKG